MKFVSQKTFALAALSLVIGGSLLGYFYSDHWLFWAGWVFIVPPAGLFLTLIIFMIRNSLRWRRRK